MESIFASQLKALNERQKQAVNHIEGPLLVIAGPGTGKTQLLSLRAANILAKTDVLPDNILCLTFTESGAQAMRQRLRGIIGEDAYKITISTYHSFGSDIIRGNPDYFRGGYDLRPINELKAYSIIRDIQKTLSYRSQLKNPQSITQISELISKSKQSLLTPLDLQTVAKDNIEFINSMSEVIKPLTDGLARASMKSLESFRKLLNTPKEKHSLDAVESLAKLWNQDLESAIETARLTKKATSLSAWKMKYLAKDDKDQLIAKGLSQNLRLIEFAGVYASYIDKLRDDSLYDYDDMILLSIDALKNIPELRFNLQERYLYIMLDEYQDTNKSQAELVYLLTNNEASEGQPNIMAVGDDDQAIYAFQGARHSNMLDFVKQYRDVRLISLKENYRSTQQLVDLSSSVAKQIDMRLSSQLNNIDKVFKAVNKTNTQVNGLHFASEIDQYVWLSQNLKNNNQDVAIIAPEHKYLERASAYLTSQNIPISYERRENILDDPQIDQFINLLRLIDAINNKDQRLTDSLLSIVINYDFWQLPTETIWKLSWRAYDKQAYWLETMLEIPQTKRIALLIMQLAANSLSSRYDVVIDQILGLSDVVINEPNDKTIRSPFLSFYSEDNNLSTSRLLQNLVTLKEQFKDFNINNPNPLMISDLANFVDQLKTFGAKIVNDFESGQTNSKIKLMTAHSVKGLEFDSVYLLSVVNEVWGPKRNNFNRLSLPLNLEYIRTRAENIDDERLRLLYVALTRAKSKLTTLSFDHDVNNKLNTPLKYLDLQIKNISSNQRTNLLPLWQQSTDIISLNSNLESLLKKRLANYVLSPTDLNTFIDVRNAGPQNFYKSVLLRYRQAVSPRLDYGSAIHDSLEWLQKSLSEDNKLPTLKKLVNEFEKFLRARRLMITDFNHLKEQGIKALSIYYEQNKDNFSVNDLSEYSFRSSGISIGNARLSGKIDKLVVDKDKQALTIVDYKTGQAYNRWGSKPKLHLYSNQLYFYKLLVNNSSAFKNYKVNGAVLDFVEPDVTTDALYKLPLTYDDNTQKRFISLLSATWDHIQRLDFPDVSKYKPTNSGIIQFEQDLIDGKI